MVVGKAILREQALNKRMLLSAEEKLLSDFYIMNSLLALKQFEEANVIFCFVGTENEIDTTPFILEALARKKRICTPRCVFNGIMEALEVTSMGDLFAGKYGIMEPKDYCPLISPEEIDLAIVPCVTCDTRGNRIGYGAGYYDRYLRGCKFPTAVLCRETFLSELIPAEENDIQIDIVITDEKVYNS